MDKGRYLVEKLDQLAASGAAARPSHRAGRKLRNGLVPRAIEKVLDDAGRPMRVCDIHVAVEDMLGLPVPMNSVKCWLAKTIHGADPRLVRLGHGRYWLMPNDGATHDFLS